MSESAQAQQPPKKIKLRLFVPPQEAPQEIVAAPMNVEKPSRAKRLEAAVQPTLSRMTGPAKPGGKWNEIQEWEPSAGAVYLARSKTTGLAYVGQAALCKYKNGKAYRYGPRGRMTDHLDAAKTHPDRLFYEALNRLGSADFRIEILRVAHCSELDELEIAHIERLMARKESYNMDSGGKNIHITERIERNLILPIEEFDVPDSVLEATRQTLQRYLDDPLFEKLESYLGLGEYDDVLLTIADKGSAPRQDGSIPRYMAVRVMMRIPGTKKFFKTFGGIHIDLEQAKADARAFVSRLPVKKENIRDLLDA